MAATPPTTLCTNCGAPAPGDYCSGCGQSTRESSTTVLGLFGDLVNNVLFSPSSKLWRTLGRLLLKPGALTDQYLKGQRASQLPPVRTYLILSVVIFLVGPPWSLMDPETHDYFYQGQPVGTLSEERADLSVQSIDMERIPARWFPERAKASNARIASIQDRFLFHDVLAGRVAGIFPNIMLGLIPATALVLGLVYWKQRRRLFDHLLFALQFQSFCLLVILLATGVDKAWIALAPNRQHPVLMQVFPWLLLVGFWLSLRRVYGENWVLTIAKSLPVIGLYWVFALYGLPIALQAALMTV